VGAPAFPQRTSQGISFPLKWRQLVVTMSTMCRNIRPLFNFAPPATEEEIRAASLQYVRKVSGVAKPSQTNQAEFDRAVEEIAQATRHLVQTLVSNAPPRDREVEREKGRARNIKRFGPRAGG
jgi:hypothetical protein